MFSAGMRRDENLRGLSFSLPSPFPVFPLTPPLAYSSFPLPSLEIGPLMKLEGLGSAVSLVNLSLKI